MMIQAKSKFTTYAVALTIVSAAAATLTVASADDKSTISKDQDRHPAIAALADEKGARADMISTNMPDGSRDVVVALPDGRYLIQRYYPSGYNVIFKPSEPGEKHVATVGAEPAEPSI